MIISNYSWAIPFLENQFNHQNLVVKHIVEVGSRDALDAIFLSNYFKCQVDVFEPDPLNILECQKNIFNLDPKNRGQLVLHNIALADVSGDMDFWSVDPDLYGNRGASSLYQINFQNRSMGDPDKGKTLVQKKIRVKSSRFDEIFISTPNLLVMDVQGGELSVLRGFGDKLKSVNAIVLETSWSNNYLGGSTFSSIHEYLMSFGFIFVSTNQGGVVSKELPKNKFFSKVFNRFQPDFDCIYINSSIF